MKKGIDFFNQDVRWYVAFALFLMVILSVKGFGTIALTHTLTVCSSAVLLEAFILYLRKRRLVFPLSAFVSGLIISVVLAPARLSYLAPIVAILSKYIIRLSGRHIFNPAAFGLLFVNILFRLPLTWWMATNLYIVVIFGLFIAYKLRKLSLIFSFTSSLLLLSIIYSLVVHLRPLASVGLLNLFFVLFMLVEPKTSPLYLKGKLIYGALVALLVVFSLWLFPNYDFLISGLIIGNLAGIFLRKAG